MKNVASPSSSTISSITFTSLYFPVLEAIFSEFDHPKGKMILTHGLKYSNEYIKGFPDISSKSIEHPQKKWEIKDISMDCRAFCPPYKNIFYGLQSGAVIMKGLSKHKHNCKLWKATN